MREKKGGEVRRGDGGDVERRYRDGREGVQERRDWGLRAWRSKSASAPAVTHVKTEEVRGRSLTRLRNHGLDNGLGYLLLLHEVLARRTGCEIRSHKESFRTHLEDA